MNRFLTACRKQQVDRPPVWIMRQAGRYLPEYRALREKAGSFLSLCTTPELAAEATLQPLRRFPLDAAIIFSDILLPLQALGVSFCFSENGGPRLTKAWESPERWAQLQVPASWESMAPVAEAIGLVRQALAPEVALLGFCGAPWTLACYLIEGHGKSDWTSVRKAVYRFPSQLTTLLLSLGQAMGSYLAFQVQAGAQAVQVFDSWAGVLPLELYQELVVPALEALFRTLDGLNVPRILYLGNGSHLLPAVASLPVEVVSVDWRTDLRVAAERTGKAVQGNLDPAALFAEKSEVRRQTKAMLQRAPEAGYIANLGHGIWPDTPMAGVEAFLAAIQEQP